MTTNTTPDPNFDNINFNADFFSSSTYLTQDEASFLYLNKTVPDTASALETFTVGISATAIQATTASIDIITGDLNASNVNSNAVGGALTIGLNTTSGTLNLATSSSRSGIVNIGNGVGASGYIDIGSLTASTRIGGTLFSTGQITATAGLQSISGEITTGGNISTTGSGTITSAGLLTAGGITSSGITSSNGITSIVSTADNFIGNGTNNSNASGNGVCSINKLQVGNTSAGSGVGTGTAFRCVIIERNVGSTSSTTGTIIIPGAPSGAGNPLVFASLNTNTTTTPYFLNVVPTGTNTFQYYKSFYNRSAGTINNAIAAATAETFNYVAIWL